MIRDWEPNSFSNCTEVLILGTPQAQATKPSKHAIDTRPWRRTTKLPTLCQKLASRPPSLANAESIGPGAAADCGDSSASASDPSASGADGFSRRFKLGTKTSRAAGR